jgi:hypothetical protein
MCKDLKSYSPPRFEPTILCSGGGRDNHPATPPQGKKVGSQLFLKHKFCVVRQNLWSRSHSVCVARQNLASYDTKFVFSVNTPERIFLLIDQQRFNFGHVRLSIIFDKLTVLVQIKGMEKFDAKYIGMYMGIIYLRQLRWRLRHVAKGPFLWSVYTNGDFDSVGCNSRIQHRTKIGFFLSFVWCRLQLSHPKLSKSLSV